jgi:hypothetical protein
VEGEAGDVEPGAEAVSARGPTHAALEECSLHFIRDEWHVPTGLSFRKTPASYGFSEVGGVLVLAEGGFWFDAIDVAAGRYEERLDVAVVFFVVDGSEALPDGAVFDFVWDAFEDYGFVGMLGGDGAIDVCGDVFCFACVRAGAEPEGVFPPDSPNKHEMRTAAGTRGGDPIVVRFFEALEGPAPGF